jgi:hypothetical protein
MFSNGYFSIGFAELIGFGITIVSVWLIVRQLIDARLASQMEGMLALGTQSSSFDEHRKLLSDLIETEKWKGFSDEEAYEFIFAKEKYREAYLALIAFFERLAILVRRRALDKGIAYDFYGRVVVLWWKALEKVTRYRRKEEQLDGIAEHWEWLAMEFEDFSG